MSLGWGHCVVIMSFGVVAVLLGVVLVLLSGGGMVVECLGGRCHVDGWWCHLRMEGGGVLRWWCSSSER